MNYVLGLIVVMALAVCVVSFPVPTLIALAIGIAWWAVREQRRGVDHDS